jgi:hypothetical protein
MSVKFGNQFKLHLPIICRDQGSVPIKSEAVFTKAVENAAFSANEVENRYMGRIKKIFTEAGELAKSGIKIE